MEGRREVMGAGGRVGAGIRGRVGGAGGRVVGGRMVAGAG